MSNAARQSKNERRDAAREKARELRLQQQRRERRNRLVLQFSIGVVIVAIVAVVAVIIVNSVRPAGPGPRNMANGGITLSGADLKAVRTPGAPGDATPTPAPTKSGKVLIQAWEDFGCPACQRFEQDNGAQIQELVKSGAAEIQYFPVAILDKHFTDGDYSTRAANAATAIANYSPDSYSAFHALLYRPNVQPEEAGPGLTDDRLIALARQVKPENLSQIERAIRSKQYVNWIGARTDEFDSDAGALAKVDFSERRLPSGQPAGPSTPTVVVNGKYYDGKTSFGSFVTSVGGAYAPATTLTPTPTKSSK